MSIGYRYLGNSGLKISSLGMGCMSFRYNVDETTPDGRLINKKIAYTSFSIFNLEPQDFLKEDKGITFTRFFAINSSNYEVFILDFETGKTINQTRSKTSEEVEGIFPDYKYTCVESDRHGGELEDFDIDLYMMELDGTGKNIKRLTRFTDVAGQKAANPVVSPEGCRIAFMRGKKSKKIRAHYRKFGRNFSFGILQLR
jgi:Tol biopolymer transport system component